MPIHWDIKRKHLEEEIELLNKANKKVTFILPVVIKNYDGFSLTETFAIVFEDKQ